MNKELATVNKELNAVLTLWNDDNKVAEIRKIYAPKLSDGEFKTFVEMGISCGLNPFLREIWAVKYDTNSPAQIFIGRDGYRKIISRNECFEGLITESVCANDEFNVDIVKGEVKHIPKIKDRGRLIGAYCIIYMRGIKIPYYVFVPIEEYSTGRSVWKDKPHTMIKKVAECQCIRMADQTCASTYSPDEMPQEKLIDTSSKANALNKEYRLIDEETGEVLSSPESETKDETKKEEQNDKVETPQHAPALKCPYSFDELKKGMTNASEMQDLNDLASLITHISITNKERDDLAKIYREKIRELRKVG